MISHYSPFRKLYLALLFLALCAGAGAQTVYTVPSANTNSGSTRFPLGAANGFERSASLYQAAEINATGSITTIGWYVNSVSSPAASTPIQIYMKQRTGNFGGVGTTLATELSGATLVYSGTLSASQLTANSWVTFTLTTPFTYLSNVLEVIVLTDYGNTGGETTTAKQIRWGTRSNGANFYETWAANNTAPAGTGTTVNQRPNIQLTITPVPVMTFSSSNTAQPQLTPVAMGSTNQVVIRANVVTGGVASPAIDLNDLTLSTNGTTALSDISNLKVYYTGSTATFASTTQVGSTIASPSTSQVIPIAQTLGLGNNYFWITYDISPAAVAGHVIDAEVTSLTVDGVARTPTTTAPAGNREIWGLQTFSSMYALQPDTLPAPRGTADNDILGVAVVVSSTGFPVNLTQLDFNTNGTTDTANIRNLKVWYTGNSKTFATGTQFGSTLPFLPGSSTFSVTGTQALANDTNYFWLAYDIDAAAAINNLLDAECTGGVVDGSTRSSTLSAPAGSRRVTLSYCTPSYVNLCTSNDFINIVTTTGGTTNISNSGSGCNGQANNYIFYPAKTLTIAQNNTFSLSVRPGTSYSQGIKAWIDYDQNGVFDNSELVMTVSPTTALSTAAIKVPCTATAGSTRMRIRCAYNVVPSSACGSESYGEAEDYSVVILSNPMTVQSVDASQNASAKAAPGSGNALILKIPVITTGCNALTATQLNLSTLGTNVPSDINAASVYYTGNSATFSTGNLFGGVFSPSGSFAVTGSQVLASDTSYFWLTYDISSAAAMGDTLDARMQSIVIGGNTYAAATVNPAGYVLVDIAMVINSATATQNISGKVEQGSSNNPILGVEIATSATGSPVFITQFDFNANGSTDTSNIRNIKLWYTGTSSNFATTTQVGSTLPFLPAIGYSIPCNQALLNGTNYFWLTYDISNNATPTNTVDAECTGFTTSTGMQGLNITAPAGSREVKGPYCASGASSTDDDDIGQVTLSIGSTTLLNNGVGCTPATNNAAAMGTYTNYSSLPAATIPQNTPVTLSICQINQLTYYQTRSAIYIDLNQNGIWDAGEMVWNQTANSGSGVPKSGSFTIPCTALTGYTRMRVVLVEGSTNLTLSDACSSFSWGETEDYTINITATPLSYQSAQALQSSVTTVAPGTAGVPVLRIPVLARGCSSLAASQFNFSTSGTTAVSDISNASVYYTGSSAVFNTATLFGSTGSPSGAFSISGSQALISDTNNFWLAYDVSASASSGNLLDATLSSLITGSSTNVIASGNPAGNILIDIPATLVSTSVSQPVLSKVEQGSANNQLLAIDVTMSAGGSPVVLTQFDLGTASSTNITDISNVKIWYTGASTTFDTTQQFGSTLASLPGGSFSIAGTRSLLNGNNRFWVSYDIVSAATPGNLVDAELFSVYLAGAATPVTSGSPAGAREIRTAYCIPVYAGSCAGGDFINRVSTTGGSINFNNSSSGCSGSSNNYGYYPAYSLTLRQGDQYVLQTRTPNISQGIRIWMDYNQDGVFDNSTEVVASIPPSTALISTTLYIPVTALTGNTRMRVRSATGAIPSTSCGSESNGETEDYPVIIQAATAPVTYVWNQTGSAAFTTATNWTPARNTPNLTDVLQFSSGAGITSTGVTDNTISQLSISNGTKVTFTASAATSLKVAGQLNLGNGKITTGNNLTIMLGTSGAAPGTLSGTGSIEGLFGRWIPTSGGSFDFPVSVGNNNRLVNVSFSNPPTAEGTLTCQFIPGAPGNNGMPFFDGGMLINKASISGLWRFTAGAGLSGGDFTGTFHADGFSGISSYADLALIRRDNNTSAWSSNGFAVSNTGSNAAPVLSRLFMNMYGEFGIGADSAINTLPVQLLSFDGTLQQQNALLKWTTASEDHNKGFEVQRSANNSEWRAVGFVEGAGNSSSLRTYSFTDVSAFASSNSQVFYYRLKQIDDNGSGNFSEVLRLTNKATAGASVTAYPNPFENEFSIAFNAAGKSNISVLNMEGREVLSLQPAANAGEYHVRELATLPAGIYLIRLSDASGSTQIKLFKTK